MLSPFLAYICKHEIRSNKFPFFPKISRFEENHREFNTYRLVKRVRDLIDDQMDLIDLLFLLLGDQLSILADSHNTIMSKSKLKSLISLKRKYGLKT